jgi:hypothetical protein
MEAKIEQQARGTRILYGATARKRREIIGVCTAIAERRGLHGSASAVR